MGRIAVASAIALSFLEILPSAFAVASCSVTQGSYTGNGTNGVNGTNYTTLTISQSGSCTWTVPTGVTQADILIVGGGGGGAGGYTLASATAGAGGGGGALQANSYPLTPGASLSLTVGAGGNGGTGSASGSNRDSTVGSQGGDTTFDQISAGGGGGGGYGASGYTTENGRPGTAGGGAGGASNHWNAYNDGTHTASGGTGTTKVVGGQTYTGVSGGVGGIYISGQSGSDTSGSGGGAAGGATSGASPAPGAAFTSLITGTSSSYGGGGVAYGATAWVLGSSPTGYGFGGWGGQQTTPGSNGNNGVIIIRYISLPILVNSFGLSGSATTSTYRSTSAIQVNLTSFAVVTFFAGGKKIPGCTKIATTGTSPNIIAQCNWKPSVHGTVALTVQYSATGSAPFSTTGPLRINASARSGNR